MSLELSHAKEYVNWMSKKIHLNHLSTGARGKRVARGEVYWCEFGLNVGSEMSKTTARPAVIIQNNKGNTHSPNTIVIPLTHDKDEGVYLVPIQTQTAPDGKVLVNGKANTSNIVCVSKARLQKRITKLTKRDMNAIDESLIDMIGLSSKFNKLEQKYNRCQERLKRVESELSHMKESSKNH